MKPIVLTFVGYYLPGYRGGGPIRTIANMVERLGDEFDFRVVTIDRDLGDPQPYSDVQVDRWQAVGKAQVFYASPLGCSFSSVEKLLRETPHDVLYLNGFFHPIFTLRPIIVRKIFRSVRRPTIVAPRGEFAESALRLKSIKKKLYLAVSRLFGLFDDVSWHASTEFEARDIERVTHVELNRIKIATNIAENPSLVEFQILPFANKSRERLRVCFLSRIAPMKNLTFALNVLMMVKSPIDFYIYGPKESTQYWGECQGLIDRLPSNISVTYGGSVEPSQVRRTIESHDVFFVPSQGENFGHVFIEAFSAGVPVLISDRTPWLGLKALNIGWDISLDRPEEFVRTLEDFSNSDMDFRRKMRDSCIQFAFEKMGSKDALTMSRRLFSEAFGGELLDANLNNTGL